MTAYYNEFDPYAAQWLRNLIDAGLIAPGVVDERSIEDVRPDELAEFTQCHFFAGIGGWSYALRLAGWPDDQPVWTGSCPCQPFSVAGKGDGFADQRHLWPAWFHLIRECRPAVVFGEQVARKDADAWIDLVQADLEGVGNAFGCVPFPAAGIGAPHARDRNYWMAYADGRNAGSERQQSRGQHGQLTQDRGAGVAQGDTSCAGLAQRISDGRIQHEAMGAQPREAIVCASYVGFWTRADWIECRDGKARPVEPGTFPLAHGIPNRVGRLRAYGNAIVPQAAAEFIRAYLEARQELRAAA